MDTETFEGTCPEVEENYSFFFTNADGGSADSFEIPEMTLSSLNEIQVVLYNAETNVYEDKGSYTGKFSA